MTQSSRSQTSKQGVILSRTFGTVLSLLWFCLSPAHANPSDLFTPVESNIGVPADLQEYLHSEQVIRHRFVTVDIEYLWNLFESARDLENFDDVERIELCLFGDFSVEMKLVKVNHSYWSSIAILVTTMPGYGTDPDANIFATMWLRRDESVSSRIWAAGEIYYVSPVEKGPLHVIKQVDPEMMPNFD